MMSNVQRLPVGVQPQTKLVIALAVLISLAIPCLLSFAVAGITVLYYLTPAPRAIAPPMPMPPPVEAKMEPQLDRGVSKGLHGQGLQTQP